MKSPFAHIIGALVMGSVALVGYGAWYATIAAKSIAVADLQTQIDTKTDTVSRMAATRATLASIAGDEMVVQSYFVPETGVVTFINELETRGKAQGAIVHILSVSAAGTPVQPSLSFDLTIGGTFDAVMRTLGSIEYAPYAISVSALTLEQNAQNGWRADLKLLVGSVSATRVATSTP